jgi:hypothetical protein
MNADGSVNMESFAKSYAELETQFSQRAPEAPVAEAAPEAAPVEAPVEEAPVLPDSLQITEPAVAPEPEVAEAPATALTDEVWGAMKGEIMRTGDVSAESRAILESAGFSDLIINDHVEAHRAHMRQGMQKAAAVVGGENEISEILGWAANNLDVSAREQINAGLAGPAWEVTLRGLEAQYKSAVAAAPKAQEMTHRASAANPASKNAARGYDSLAEFSGQRADPRYGKDPRYTDSVNNRAGLTDWTQIR